jgi:hypothetical protein
MPRTPVIQRPASWPPDRSIREVQKRLEALSPFKGANSAQVKNDFSGWKQVTWAALEKAFSDGDKNLSNFSFAGGLGPMRIGGNSPAQDQQNFERRVQAFETALNSAIADLKMSMPEEALGVYEAEDPFEFYRDLKGILRNTTREIFVVDAYIDASLFELYLGDVPEAVQLRVLSNNLQSSVLRVAKLFAQSHPNFEMRATPSLHDRVLFIDDRCWVVGQSLKDAAMKKPTYMVEISAEGMKPSYEALWAAATLSVKS